MASPAGARCALHPIVAAVDLCQRCGTFVCGECVHIRSEDVFCAACASILYRPTPVRLKVAFALAGVPAPICVWLTWVGGGPGTLLGLGLMLPLGASALALLLQERAARRTDKSASKGRFYRLTWAMLALDLLGTASLVLFIVRRAAEANQ